MKKRISLLLSALFLLALTACGGGAASSGQPENESAVVDDSQFVLTKAEGDTVVPGGGSIAFAGNSDGISTGVNLSVWRGVQNFATNFQYQAAAFTAKDATQEAAVAALREASESGAAVVVCNGDMMAQAVYQLQDNYPTVSYLLLDGEPHSADYAKYKTAANVHCVLFAEEQAGYLAGYVAVQEGNKDLGFLGAEQLPGIVRYCTGFLQGAEAAAEEEGVHVTLRTWYCATDAAGEAITAKMEEWFSGEVDLILVSGGSLTQSVATAADSTGGRVIATDWDQSSLSARIRTSAVKCYNRVTQQQLYNFFAAGGVWDDQTGGQTHTAGYTEDAVALATNEWRIRNYSVESYAVLYEEMRQNALRVGRYSDMATLPTTPGVTVQQDN